MARPEDGEQIDGERRRKEKDAMRNKNTKRFRKGERGLFDQHANEKMQKHRKANYR
jgi:hypothetical protein